MILSPSYPLELVPTVACTHRGAVCSRHFRLGLAESHLRTTTSREVAGQERKRERNDAFAGAAARARPRGFLDRRRGPGPPPVGSVDGRRVGQEAR